MLWLFALAAALQASESARVLILAPFCSPSQGIYFRALAEALAAKEHTVTLVTGLEPLEPLRSLRQVRLPNVVGGSVPKSGMFSSGKLSVGMGFFGRWSKDCNDALDTLEMRRLREEDFDVALLSTLLAECFLSVVHEQQIPYAFACPHGLTGFFNDAAFNPQFLSLDPNVLMDLGYPLTFSGRVLNTLAELSFRAAYFYYLPKLEDECRSRGLCAPDMPSTAQMIMNSSLFITNSMSTLDTPIKPSVPTVVYAGGIHCKPARPLPQELEEWVAGAGDAGFIYFSLGTVVETKEMPEVYKETLLEVFASLEQRVLCKWDLETIKGDVPPNVRLAKWLPQQDILGHPSLRLFITHGGLLSTQEATYHGVPLLGLPVILDQHYNMRNVQREGWGLYILWQDLSYDSLRSHILRLMTDASVRKEASRRSLIMRDRPVPPGEWVAYWVEYVLRHEGALHLRSPATSMPWYELYNADVWVFLLLGMLTGVLLSLKVLASSARCLWRLLPSKEKKAKQQ